VEQRARIELHAFFTLTLSVTLCFSNGTGSSLEKSVYILALLVRWLVTICNSAILGFMK